MAATDVMEHDDWNQPGQRTWAHWLGLIFNLVGWATFVTIVTLVLVGALSPHLCRFGCDD
jgi:hypothetical protein